MSLTLPALPYSKTALMPYISEETLEYHHGKHHQTYVNNLNTLTEGSPLSHKPLDEIVKTEKGAIFNNAAQVWNHTFYWHSIAPKAGGNPHGKIAELINQYFTSFESFKEQFDKAALGQFGSGWAWLVRDKKNGDLVIKTTSNAGCPLVEDLAPIITCDVWEHAYYIDYRNARAKYIDAWWHLVNWDFANQNLKHL